MDGEKRRIVDPGRRKQKSHPSADGWLSDIFSEMSIIYQLHRFEQGQ